MAFRAASPREDDRDDHRSRKLDRVLARLLEPLVAAWTDAVEVLAGRQPAAPIEMDPHRIAGPAVRAARALIRERRQRRDVDWIGHGRVAHHVAARITATATIRPTNTPAESSMCRRSPERAASSIGRG
jgi:hypothetical protein